MKKNIRLDYIDLIKGFGIISIVAIHVLNNSNLLFPNFMHYITFFMITVFYTIIGWIYYIKNDYNRDVKLLIKKRLQTLIIPYLYFSLIIICFDIMLIIFKYNSYKQLFSDIYRTICLAGIGTLWFLPTLFIAEIIFYITISKKNDKIIYTVIISFIVVTVGVGAINLIRSESLMFDILSAPVIVILKGLFGFLFCIFGYYMCKLYKSIELKLSLTIRIFLSSILIIIGYISSNSIQACDFNHLTMKNPLQYIAISLFINLSIILFCKNICDLNINFKPVLFYGKNSLIIMATHYSILIPVLKFMSLNNILNDNIIFLIILLLEIPISLVIQKYFPNILGKTKSEKMIIKTAQ